MKVRFLDTVLREAAVAAADNGDEPLTDADLLGRFVRGRDHTAFAVLVKRHARLVWAVCRQVTAAPGDAEDAFQAVWLTLVRRADSVRDANALTAWLHGTAYRVCAKANQTAARRRLREERAAPAEATRPVSDATWDALLAAVHEEIARLPAGLRTAFVVCELEGVPPGAAAVRLGWKHGTLTGRLCQARQALVTRLTRRGLAPAAALAGCGVGAVTAGATAPPNVLAGATSLPVASAVIPSPILELANFATEGTMTRMKLLAAGVIVASALGLGGAAGVFAQRPGTETRPQPGTATAASPNAGGGVTGTGTRATAAANPWEYKVEPMPADRLSLMNLLRTRGDEGWEYCGTATFGGARTVGATGGERLNLALGESVDLARSLTTLAGAVGEGSTTDLIFKRPRHSAARGGNPTGGANPFRGGNGGPLTPGDPVTPMPGPGTTNNPFTLGVGGGRGAATLPGAGEVEIKVVRLKRAKGADAGRIATQLFDGQLTVAVDEATNSLVLKGATPVLESVLAVLARLDELERLDDGRANPTGGK